MFHKALFVLITFLTASAALTASAQEQNPAAVGQTDAQIVEYAGGQVSVPVGVTLIVKKITVGADATLLNVVVSYDGDSPFVNLAAGSSFLNLGEGQQLFLRAVPDNHRLRIGRGQTLEGDLVFPGTIPAGTESVTLVLNEGNEGTDRSAPGLSLPLQLRASE